MDKDTLKAKFNISHVILLYYQMTADRIERALVDESSVFPCQYHLTVVLHSHISLGQGQIRRPFLAKVPPHQHRMP